MSAMLLIRLGCHTWLTGNLNLDLDGSGQTRWVRDDSFCIRLRISPPLSPNSSLIDKSTSRDHTPRTLILMLCCFTKYPGYGCLSFHLRGPYFLDFSSTFCAQLSIHGQLISDLLLVIDESCIHSVLRQVLMFSEYWYIPVRLYLRGLIQGL